MSPWVHCWENPAGLGLQTCPIVCSHVCRLLGGMWGDGGTTEQGGSALHRTAPSWSQHSTSGCHHLQLSPTAAVQLCLPLSVRPAGHMDGGPRGGG